MNSGANKSGAKKKQLGGSGGNGRGRKEIQRWDVVVGGRFRCPEEEIPFFKDPLSSLLRETPRTTRSDHPYSLFRFYFSPPERLVPSVTVVHGEDASKYLPVIEAL